MLELRHATAGYGANLVIPDLSLHVEQGETIALLGPNGAGKSTLMAAITGTLRRRGGDILFENRNMTRLDSHQIVAAGIALVPEGRLIFPPFSVHDNLVLGATRLAGRIEDRFEFVYALFPRLKERARQAAGTLSGGEQQMLAIGRALMSSPRLLLLDEPFLGLAPMVVQEIRAALRRLQSEGLTILLVEQKLDIALEMASRAYVMIKGRIELEDSSAALAGRSDLDDLYFALAEAQT